MLCDVQNLAVEGKREKQIEAEGENQTRFPSLNNRGMT
jgi:hypothetical protein